MALHPHMEKARDGRLFCRGTAVALAAKGVLFLGASGSGKSGLALEMMAFGATLIADDGVWLDEANRLQRPEQAPALIEARGIGLLRAECLNEAPLALIIDLDHAPSARLPGPMALACPGGEVPVIFGKSTPSLAAALCQYLRNGRGE